MNLEELGNAIKSYRSRLGFTQGDLAAALQVSPQAVSKWERGENAPDIALLPQISEVLGASIDTLLGAHYREKRVLEATVLFADMAGFGSLSRSLSPADLAIALNSFFYPLGEHIIARDGLVIKYIGDEVLAIFLGACQRERALNAAFACREASPRPLRISLSTGLVWMGSLGHPLSACPDVLGPAVNIASTLHEWMKEKLDAGGEHHERVIAATGSTVELLAGTLELGIREERTTWCAEGKFMVYEVKGPKKEG